MLLFLIHPLPFFILHHSVSHVNRLRGQLSQSPPKKHSDNIARHTLIDLLDSCGVDFQQFETFLVEHQDDIRKHAKGTYLLDFTHLPNSRLVDDARRIMATCQPSDALKPVLRQAIRKIANSPAVDKPRLFIKPADLVSGVAAFPGKEERERDVVTKAFLLKKTNVNVCLRCGGKSEIGLEAQSRSVKWMAWEGYAHMVCICFGPWATVAV